MKPYNLKLPKPWYNLCTVKSVNKSHYRLEVPRGFQEVKVPRLGDRGPGW